MGNAGGLALKLTAKQAVFVAEYLVDLNATQAAIRAKYSRKTAEQQGSRLLRNVQVKAAVEVALAERKARLGVKADDVLGDVARLAAKAEVDGEYSAALRGRELLGKHVGLWTDKIEHSGAIARPLQGKSADEILAKLKGPA